jgi:hypothetical protein
MAGCATPHTTISEDLPIRLRPEFLAIQQYTLGVDSRAAITVVEDLVREALNSAEESKKISAELRFVLHLPNTSLDAKRAICQQLWLVAQPGDVPSIARLLNHIETADMARYAIERIDHEIVDNELLYYLKQGPESAKPGIINSLAMRGSEAALVPIQGYVDHRNPAVSEAAVAAVARLEIEK